ncbi:MULTISPECIES: GTPase Era [Rickettsieae]|uniref:GTPase Era n=1 Tax=Rickettsieae TaxID=33988 RepID=UPI000B9A8BDE|nr:GTPase Era [Rickettsia endosymbiont of Culicoides newsteadi]MDN3030134.1 GTPase Era [Candidatus Tisiphia sp.]OZG32126.1 GTPase Era [Rickettsia endosymbiont of Culicoides newsteadi]
MEIFQKTISISIIGKPNAGKSSLLNKLIGQKISIVTPKVQTTRSIITGIVTIKDTQLIILDTPGIFEPKKQLEKAMVRCAWSSLHGVDLVLLIIDSTKPIDQFTLQILKKLQTLKINLIFLLNKIDIPSEYLEEIENTLNSQFVDSYILKLSVLSGKNVNKLLNYIQSHAKESPWLYEEDDVTNLPMRFLAAEITREQLFLNLHQELPYNLTVQTEMWQENNDKSIKIHQVIIVSRDSYKTIILGKNGCKIKEIGSKARIEMQISFDCKIHLFLFVKVRELWQDDPNSYSHMRLQQT